MLRLIIVLTSFALLTGCSRRGNVVFEWFNLSTNQVWVTGVAGIPDEASCGRMMPDPAEDRLHVKASHFMEPVQVAREIKVTWKEDTVTAWQGGLKPGELVPPGASHDAAFDRTELGIPSRLNSGTIRFTYLGNRAWKVRLVTASDTR
jgi:hypothetical protein